MKKLSWTIAAMLLLSVMTTMAQKSFTLDDLMSGGSNFWNLQPKNLYTAWWGDRLVRLDVDQCTVQGEKKPFLTTTAVNATLSEADGRVTSLLYARFPYADRTQALLYTGKAELLYDWKKGKTVWKRSRIAGASHTDLNMASKAEAYMKDWNLYVLTAEGKQLQVSADGSRELVYGQSVHRDEFGISKGTFWNPQGTLLAFYRMDQSMVTDYPMVDIAHRVAQPAPEKYPMAGMTSHKVSVGVFNPATQQTVYLKTADPTDRYFTNIAWSPDGKTIYVNEVNRDQNHAQLISYDAASGQKLKVVLEERNSKYIEPMTPIVFLPWDDSKFIYQSRNEGYNALYLYNTDGKRLSKLTDGKFEVIDLLGFNRKTKSAIYTSTEVSPLQHNVFSVQIANGKRQRIDDGTGVHYPSLSAGTGAYVVDNYSSPQIPRKIDLTNTANGKRQNLLTADDPWKGYNVPEITCGTIKAADDSTDLYYRMVKPVNFDPNKKYPTVVYVYGGPHARNVMASRNYLTRGWEIYMAQRGYLLFILDNRGSSERGLAFENVTFRHLGEEEMKDQMRGVEFLKSLPYVDADRMGVHGWSFGGFMTTNLMLTYPDVFKVGVAGGPVIDWKFYEVMYGERYMDTPQSNPEGYKNCSLLNKAGNLKGRLQIIVGYNDPTCVMQHSLSFLRACEDAGTQPDYFVYPGDGHNMMGKDMVHLHERITRYFDDYLK